jgi:exopolyphosphatase/guanosine-5'-triphosphate,3'-diphosphate pyrophosphatase
MKSKPIAPTYPIRMGFIDLGSNTFNLLIAEIQVDHSFDVLLQDKIGVGIGKNGMNKKAITTEAMNRGLEALIHFEKTMYAYGVTQCLAIGTSALRNAQNAHEFVQLVAQKTNIHITIIDGAQEATYIYRGVHHEINNQSSVLVMDIGGGSVEFIIGKGNEILWKTSLEIGGLRLLEQFTISDPISLSEQAEITHFFKASLLPVFQAIEVYQPTQLIGASGSFDTLADIDSFAQHQTWSKPQQTYSISQQTYHQIASNIINSNRKERLKIPGMIELRVELMPLAILLINEVNQWIKNESIVIARSSMKEGILIEQIHLFNHQ